MTICILRSSGGRQPRRGSGFAGVGVHRLYGSCDTVFELSGAFSDDICRIGQVSTFIDDVRNYGPYLRLFWTKKGGTATSGSSYKNVQLLQNGGKVELLFPLAPRVFTKNQTGAYCVYIA